MKKQNKRTTINDNHFQDILEDILSKSLVVILQCLSLEIFRKYSEIQVANTNLATNLITGYFQ